MSTSILLFTSFDKNLQLKFASISRFRWEVKYLVRYFLGFLFSVCVHWTGFRLFFTFDRRSASGTITSLTKIFFIFEILALFEFSNGQKYWHFFVTFVEIDISKILVEFESNRMSPRESAKNGRIVAYELTY